MKIKALALSIGIPIFIFAILSIASDKNFTGTPYSSSVDKSQLNVPKTKLAPPKIKLDLIKSYSAVLKTSEGDITIKLNVLDAPISSTNFVYLSRLDFYNNLIFHRVIKDFMIQGGDPKGDGTGNPGYLFNDEAIVGEYVRGTVAMANAGKNTNGSQFFVVVIDQPDLPKNYVIFGKVTAGMDVVDKISNAPVEDNGKGEVSKPVTPVVINSVQIIEE
jgi:cyclophilin family peptidyl-prolyl cis-trans isomerase